MGHDRKNTSSDPIDWAATQSRSRYNINNEQCDKSDRFSFWKDAPMFQSTIDGDMFSDPINQFIIQSIKNLGNNKKALIGNKQVAIVSGTFAESNYSIGQKVDVFPCLCCLQRQVLKKNSKNSKKEDDFDSGEKIEFDSECCNSLEDQNACEVVYDDPSFENKVIFIINDQTNSILIEDDVLTVTSFCKALECINNPILKELVADFSFEFAHPSLVIGIIIHEVIQSSLMTKNASFAFLSSEAKRIIKENLFNLYCCNINDREALNEVLKHMKNIIGFLSKGFSVETVEQRVYSSCYGLKGSIDCVDRNYVIEIKTGKHHSLVHRSQAILYTLLLMEQRLKKRCRDYNQFLFDMSDCLGTNEDLSPFYLNKTKKSEIESSLQLLDVTNSEVNAKESKLERNLLKFQKGIAATKKTANNSEQCKIEKNFNVEDAEVAIKPLLYYVKSGDFVNIDLKHEEISYLLKIRNDIACNKGISACGCPENYPCSILNKIQLLPNTHFLKKQYNGIELEKTRSKNLYKGVLLNQSRNKVAIKLVEDASISDYCYFYSLNEKYISYGLIESYDRRVMTVNLNEEIEIDRMVLIGFENDSNFLKFMRWSLINVAYMKYIKRDYVGSGIDSFSLPGQNFGLEDPEVELNDSLGSFISLDSIELQEISLDSSNMNSDDITAILDSNDNDISENKNTMAREKRDKGIFNLDNYISKRHKVVINQEECNRNSIILPKSKNNLKSNFAAEKIQKKDAFSSKNIKLENKNCNAANESSSANLESFSISQLSFQALDSDSSNFLEQIFSDEEQNTFGSLENNRGISDIFNSSDDSVIENSIKVNEKECPNEQIKENFMNGNRINEHFSVSNIDDNQLLINDKSSNNHLSRYKAGDNNYSAISCNQNQSSDQIFFDLESVSTDQNVANIKSQINLSFLEDKATQDSIRKEEKAKCSKPTILFNETSNPSFDYFTPVNNSLSSVEYRYSIPDIFKNEFLRLNDDQRAALFAALNCDNYKIIHGMPGTGKSTVIALLIRILIHYNQKVLFVSYTHLAIQNVLNRVGSIRYYRAKKDESKFNTVEEIQKYFNQIDLVAGTCYSFTDPIYINRKFDYCIIDEGSQIHLLLALIPISLAKRFCMVGDHLQLRPLCKKSTDLTLSLFEYLADKCSTLTYQYRMGDEIMRLSNTLFYNNRLQGFGGQSTVEFIDIKTINFKEYIESLKDITVLCYFNQKVKEILQINKDIVVTTIDKYQGSESDEILVVFDPIDKCEILESGERLNVALTRARKKLFLLGDKLEMVNIPILKKLLEII